MSQYVMTESSSQADWALSEQVAQQLQRFMQPFLELLDAYVDGRLVETFWQTMVAIIVARTSLLVSVLGEYLADPQQGPAGSKQLSRLVHSAKWGSRLIEQFLWRQAEQGCVMRWPKRYQVLDRTGMERKAWQVETSFRYGKSELRMESPRLQQWEPRRKLLLIVTLVYAFLLSLLGQEHDLLRQGLLERWCHRTGRRARKTRAPLYRLRWALSHLWHRYPPACMGRSPQPGRPPWVGQLPAWLLWVLVLNLCPKSSG